MLGGARSSSEYQSHAKNLVQPLIQDCMSAFIQTMNIFDEKPTLHSEGWSLRAESAPHFFKMMKAGFIYGIIVWMAKKTFFCHVTNVEHTIFIYSDFENDYENKSKPYI